ncbi:MAG: hypothetical protein IJ379_14875, partial [Lachnospiraceae bacterium]|nr:hypothetical protein [Lachnospiraceae bacterium]
STEEHLKESQKEEASIVEKVAEESIEEPLMTAEPSKRAEEKQVEEQPMTTIPPKQAVQEVVTGSQETEAESPIEKVADSQSEEVTTKQMEQEQTEASQKEAWATAAPHLHDISIESGEATCLENGWYKEYCKSCGQVLQENITSNALGHAFEKAIWELPTCQKSGYYNNICARCGLVECITQNPLPHQVEDIVIQEGNCMEDTVIRHVCKQCGLQTESDTRAPVYDTHKWLTETVDGEVLTSCEWCGVAK